MRKIKVNFGRTYGSPIPPPFYFKKKLCLCPLLFLKSYCLSLMEAASLTPPYAKGRGRRGNRRFSLFPYSCAGIFEILLSSFGHETLASLNSKHVPVWSLY